MQGYFHNFGLTHPWRSLEALKFLDCCCKAKRICFWLEGTHSSVHPAVNVTAVKEDVPCYPRGCASFSAPLLQPGLFPRDLLEFFSLFSSGFFSQEMFGFSPLMDFFCSFIPGTLVSHVTLRLMKPECELDESWCQEELPTALSRVVSLLHAHTIPSRTGKGEAGKKYCRSFLSTISQ